MLRELNGMLKRISGLQEQIQEMQNSADRARDQIQNEINESVPSFGTILDSKVETSTGSESSGGVNDEVQSIQETISTISKQEGFDEDLIRSVIKVESNFDPEAVSEDGAKGLMQLMPSTAEELGVDPENPQENVKGGVKYLGKLLDKYGNVREALAAYNAGPGAVDEYDGVPPFPETQNYVKKVLSTFRQLKQSGT